MQEVKYIIEDRLIASILGRQNFTDKESAILELVKNAYDANATIFQIKFYKGENKEIELRFFDDGSGMNADIIENKWMYIGKSEKEYYVAASNKKRIAAGSKGIGKFALSRLGADVVLYSKMKNSNGICWKTNWQEHYLSEDATLQTIGTDIVIKKLNDKWNKSSIKKLVDFLSRSYNDDQMEIEIDFLGEKTIIENIMKTHQLGIDHTANLNLFYDSQKMKLKVEINSDEFNDDVSSYIGYERIALKKKIDEIDILQELYKNDAGDTTELAMLLKDLGDFSARLYFRLRSLTQKDFAEYKYKHLKLSKMVDSGIILYRNGFSISSFEGRSDWLGIDARASQSPAAASHLSGSWKVRSNEIFGQVLIDKKANDKLQDLSNRQGLDKNEYYDLFVQIIDIGLKNFESYRQDIIRKIRIKNDEHIVKEEQQQQINKILSEPQQIAKLSHVERKQLVDEIAVLLNKKEQLEYQVKQSADNNRYEIAVLNVLATLGLEKTAIAHEIETNRNNLESFTPYVRNALESLGFWEQLNLPENTKYHYKNVPQLLEQNEVMITNILKLVDITLNQVKRNHFIEEYRNLHDFYLEMSDKWQTDYAWIKINTNITKNTKTFVSKDTLYVIFNNLILNSVQQNSEKERLDIDIKFTDKDGKYIFSYSDNGKGLPKKYQQNPRRILEPHESTREGGHGLGMWIVNNTIMSNNGAIETITAQDGFAIDFYLEKKEQ